MLVRLKVRILNTGAADQRLVLGDVQLTRGPSPGVRRTDYGIESPRVTKREQLSARRFHHKVKLSSPREVDAELQRRLKDAYELSG